MRTGNMLEMRKEEKQKNKWNVKEDEMRRRKK
jgi:hypothetical protein